MSNVEAELPWYMTESGWALAEIEDRLAWQYINVKVYLSGVAEPLDDGIDEDALQVQARQKRVANLLRAEGGTLSCLYILRERIESGDRGAIDDWVDVHNRWGLDCVAPLTGFDETDY